MKTCLSCEHCWKSFNRAATCTRKTGVVDVVGDIQRKDTNCYYERSNWPRIFGKDTCGKEAQYWTPKKPRTPPRGGSTIEHLGDLYWVEE